MFEMTKTSKAIVFILGLVILLFTAACSSAKQSGADKPPNTSTIKVENPVSARPPEGAARAGEVTGSYTANGETVNLKYAYAGRAQRFGEESIVVLLTDQPIPPEAVAEEIKSQPMLLDKKIRGLEYAIGKDGYWVRFHPGQYQESKSKSLSDYSLENDVVKGSDEDAGDLTNGKYKRSVKFTAPLSK
jgi:hypothetical protein